MGINCYKDSFKNDEKNTIMKEENNKNHIENEEKIQTKKENNKDNFEICINTVTQKPIKIKILPNVIINCENLNNLDMKSRMTHIFILKDGRFTACFIDGSINIYNKFDYKIEATIYAHKNPICYHMQLANGNILTCSKDNTIKIISLKDYSIIQTLNHDDLVCEALERNNNQIISVCIDGYIYIWEKKVNNKEYILSNKFLIYNKVYYINILLINNNEIVSLNNEDFLIKFWNINKCNLIKSLENKDKDTHIKSIYFEKSLNLLLCPNYYENDFFETLIIIDTLKHEIIWDINYCFINIIDIIGYGDGKVILYCQDKNYCISFNLENKECPFEFNEIITCDKFKHNFFYLNNELIIIHYSED